MTRKGILVRSLPLRRGRPPRRSRLVYRPDVTDAELDQLCGDYVKRRDGWTCQRCGRVYVPYPQASGRLVADGLDWAHFITRVRKKTCWNPLNTIAWCAGCHFYMDRMPHEKIAFAVARLGQAEYDRLRFLSQASGKVDRAMKRLELKQLLRDFDAAQAS